MEAQNTNKEAELKQYLELVMAAINYSFGDGATFANLATFDVAEYASELKQQATEHHAKGRLTKLKQWFRDMCERHVEMRDLQFNNYLIDETGYDIDIFQSFFDRINKVVEKVLITTDNQYYDIKILVDQLCGGDQQDMQKIEKLNGLLATYENKRAQRISK